QQYASPTITSFDSCASSRKLPSPFRSFSRIFSAQPYATIPVSYRTVTRYASTESDARCYRFTTTYETVCRWGNRAKDTSIRWVNHNFRVGEPRPPEAARSE